MPAHLLSRSLRARHVAVLTVALAAGLLAVVLVGDGGEEPDDQRSDRATSSSPTVLGNVVDDSALPDASPAAPAVVTPLDGSPDAVLPGSPVAGTAGPPPEPTSTTAATPSTDPVLIPPTVVDNTTTTTAEPTTSTSSSTTTTSTTTGNGG